MKTNITIASLLLLCGSCGTIHYVPIQTVKTEYRDKIVRDSIVRYDSVFVKELGDTVYMERYRYLYRDKIVRDSIHFTDTIRVPYPVEVTKEVKKPLTKWQQFQIWCGRFSLVVVIGSIFFLIRRLSRGRLF
jgi:hypothetical protein